MGITKPCLPDAAGPGATYQSHNPTLFVIFGATGDLARRFLIPALFDLHEKHLLPPLFQVIGFSRREFNVLEFQNYIVEVMRGRGKTDKKTVASFAKLFSYVSGLFEERAGYDNLARQFGMKDGEWRACSNKLFYLATPPAHYGEILANLKESGLTRPCSPREGWSRVMVEKPFGRDAQSAEELDRYLAKLFEEEQIYRIDHYMGKDTVQNILAFRFSNSFFEPVWNREHIESIRLQFMEAGGLENRGTFYDGVGAFRDVGQNHLCQLLANFAMERPASYRSEDLRRARFEVLNKLVAVSDERGRLAAYRAQYEGYGAERGVVAHSETETYFLVKAEIKNARWEGVPIYFEGGKHMERDLVQVIITFKHPAPCLCAPGSDHSERNIIRYEMKPREGIFTSFNVKRPGHDMVIEERDFQMDYRKNDTEKSPSAYEKLILEAIAGNQTLFVSTEETMASWRFVDPVLTAWGRDRAPLALYPHGSHPLIEGEPEEKLKEISVIGLGKMGKNIALRLVEKKWRVLAYDALDAARDAARGEVEIASSIADLVLGQSERAPRLVWLMVPAFLKAPTGKPVRSPVDEVLFDKKIGLMYVLNKGDVVIDGGNSFYEDTVRRAKWLKKRGVHFIDVGFSGGPAGARHGGCLMIGGDKKVFEKYRHLFSDLSLPQGFSYVGESGAGHFVKMVHNGIEYGMMQAIAEGFAVMKKAPFKLDLKEVARVYNKGSVIESRLVGWLGSAFASFGVDLKGVSGAVGHLGEGEWTVKTAKKLKVPTPVIKDSFEFRVDSARHPSFTGQILSALRNQFGGHNAGSARRKAQGVKRKNAK